MLERALWRLRDIVRGLWGTTMARRGRLGRNSACPRIDGPHLNAHRALFGGQVAGRHVVYVDAHRTVLALMLPGGALGFGLFVDGALVWTTDWPAGKA
jgi:hypothetical protein